MSAMTLEERQCQLLKECTDDPHCLRLIQFFGRFPNARFSRLAIIHALNDGKVPVEKALTRLTEKEVLYTIPLNKVTLYYLTQEEPIRRFVLGLAQLDRSQWRQLMKNSVDAHALSGSRISGR